MKKYWFLAAIVIAMAQYGVADARQGDCDDRDKIVAYLGKSYGESRIGIGLSANGSAVELYVSEAGTWTVLMTAPGGPTCIVGVGEGWQREEPTKPKTGRES